MHTNAFGRGGQNTPQQTITKQSVDAFSFNSQLSLMQSKAFSATQSNNSYVFQCPQSQRNNSFAVTKTLQTRNSSSENGVNKQQQFYEQQQQQQKQTFFTQEISTQQTNQLNEMQKLLEQLQQFVHFKFNEYEERMAPCLDNGNSVLPSLLERSEQLLISVAEKVDKLQNLKPPKNTGDKSNRKIEKDIQEIKNIVDSLDVKLNFIKDEVNQMSAQQTQFHLHVMEIVNTDKCQNNERLQRVMTEMENAKKSLKKHIVK